MQALTLSEVTSDTARSVQIDGCQLQEQRQRATGDVLRSLRHLHDAVYVSMSRRVNMITVHTGHGRYLQNQRSKSLTQTRRCHSGSPCARSWRILQPWHASRAASPTAGLLQV